MSASIQDRVIQIVSDVTGVPISKLDGNSSPESVSEWESMKHINIVLAIEEEFGLHFDDEEITELKGIKSLVSLIENQL